MFLSVAAIGVLVKLAQLLFTFLSRIFNDSAMYPPDSIINGHLYMLADSMHATIEVQQESPQYENKIIKLARRKAFFSRVNVLDGNDVMGFEDTSTFDFIIVGGGSAGCVLANRLTEVKDWSVLLIEAGDNPSIMSNVPALSLIVDSSYQDWNRNSVDDGRTAQAHKNKTIHMTSGKMLAGSSGANYMYNVRGNKADFEVWVSEGNNGWDWDTVTYYYKKSERFRDSDILNSPSGSLHNTNGYLGITRPVWPEQTETLFSALTENNRSILLDTNGFQQIGYSQPQYIIDDAIRQSTAVAFIRPIKNRPNFYILRNTRARKIILDKNNTAIGVEIKLSDGTIMNTTATKEVILSTGSFISPQLLMLSGIGPSDELKELDIKVKVDSPLVGKTSQDHPFILLVITGDKNPLAIVENLEILSHLYTFPIPSVLGFEALDKLQSYPDYQITTFPLPPASLLTPILCTHVMKLEDNICATVVNAVLLKKSLVSLITLLHSYSRGEIKLKNKDPEESPLIYTGYFTDDRDLEKFALCVEDFLTIVNTTVFKDNNAEVLNMNVEQCSNFTFGNRDYWKCLILNTVNSQFHTSGTCRMGKEGYGVVNQRLQVYGTNRLRVIDASIMPNITSGNINAPTMMIAEKAADMIKEDHGIPISLNN